ncbi:MAG: HDOD domain-containing protein [Deltaproteobacteria bacterium]|nr:HDOD domain-containing protein [Deltaproteobacteria bacterium]
MEIIELKEKLRSIKTLPTFPYIVEEVLRVLDDPKSSAKDLAKKMDASMTGEVLRIANSAYYGTRNFRTINSVEHAIAIIGFQPLLSLLLQMPFLSLVVGTNGQFDEKYYLRHSMLTAVLSKTLSRSLGLGDPNVLYVGGMIHDLGKVVIYSLFGKEWEEIRRLITEEKLPTCEAERKVLGTDHAYIGGTLLDHWNIPGLLVNNVKFHHEPDLSEGHSDYALCIYLGDSICRGIEEIILGEDKDLLKEKLREILFNSVEFEKVREDILDGYVDELFYAIIEIKPVIRGLS